MREVGAHSSTSCSGTSKAEPIALGSRRERPVKSAAGAAAAEEKYMFASEGRWAPMSEAAAPKENKNCLIDEGGERCSIDLQAKNHVYHALASRAYAGPAQCGCRLNGHVAWEGKRQPHAITIRLALIAPHNSAVVASPQWKQSQA